MMAICIVQNLKAVRKLFSPTTVHVKIIYLSSGKLSCTFTNPALRRLFGSQLIQPCAAPSSGAQYPPTVLCKAAPSSPFVVNPSPGPLLPLMTFRTNAEAVTMGERKSLYLRREALFKSAAGLGSFFFPSSVQQTTHLMATQPLSGPKISPWLWKPQRGTLGSSFSQGRWMQCCFCQPLTMCSARIDDFSG